MSQKWIALLLALILALPVTGCAADKPQGESVGTTANLWLRGGRVGSVRSGALRRCGAEGIF